MIRKFNFCIFVYSCFEINSIYFKKQKYQRFSYFKNLFLLSAYVEDKSSDIEVIKAFDRFSLFSSLKDCIDLTNETIKTLSTNIHYNKKLEKEGNLKKHIPKNRKGANVMENVESGCQRKNYNFCIIGNIYNCTCCTSHKCSDMNYQRTKNTKRIYLQL